jgi:adenosylmethionine-8-amino-7-oxononanoate aminotransferase
MVGDIRGLGFLAGIELVADRAAKTPFATKAAMAARAASLCLDEGVVVYPCSGGVDGESGDYLLMMPPFVTPEDDLVRMAERTGRALARLGREVC